MSGTKQFAVNIYDSLSLATTVVEAPQRYVPFSFVTEVEGANTIDLGFIPKPNSVVVNINGTVQNQLNNDFTVVDNILTVFDLEIGDTVYGAFAI